MSAGTFPMLGKSEGFRFQSLENSSVRAISQSFSSVPTGCERLAFPPSALKRPAAITESLPGPTALRTLGQVCGDVQRDHFTLAQG